jgi:hypothetical protein
MLTLKQMEDFGLHQLCVDLCKNMINSQVSDGSEIKYLLPVKYIISGWNVFDSAEFKNPITGEEYVESWENEDERVRAILEINKRIEEYNVEVAELDSKYDDLEERVKNQLFRTRPPFELWSLTAWMHKPVHGKLPEIGQKTPFDARHFNSEPIYRKLMNFYDNDEAVGKFNKMLYEYIEAVTDGKQLIETSTFYYPKLEFDDYMMRGGCAEYINLLEEKEIRFEDKSQMLKEGTLITPFATITPEALWAECAPSNRKYLFSDEFEESPPPNTVYDYDIKIDLKNKMFIVASNTEVSKKVEASFSECGLANKTGKPNRLLALLIRYAYFQREAQGKPFIDKSQLWDEIVKGKYSMNTIHRYHKGLSKALTRLFCLYTPRLESGESVPEGAPIWSDSHGGMIVEKCFVRKRDEIRQRNTKGEEETIDLIYHDCMFTLKLKDKITQLKETGYEADGIEQYGAQLDSEGNLIGQ